VPDGGEGDRPNFPYLEKGGGGEKKRGGSLASDLQWEKCFLETPKERVHGLLQKGEGGESSGTAACFAKKTVPSGQRTG